MPCISWHIIKVQDLTCRKANYIQNVCLGGSLGSKVWLGGHTTGFSMPLQFFDNKNQNKLSGKKVLKKNNSEEKKSSENSILKKNFFSSSERN